MSADLTVLEDLLRQVLVELAGIRRGVSVTALATAPAPTPPQTFGPPLKTKACTRCGAPIVWGVFGNDRPACIEPDSLRVGFDLRPGKFAPVPHFERNRGHLLHACGGAR